MSNTELLATARTLADQDVEWMQVWTPQGWKAPKGFPRRTLLCKPTAGGSTWTVSVQRLIAWLEKQ
jgi:hypothetical protein